MTRTKLVHMLPHAGRNVFPDKQRIAVTRVMSERGPLCQVAASICRLWRDLADVPIARLWVLNAHFGQLELLSQVSTESHSEFARRLPNRRRFDPPVSTAIHGSKVLVAREDGPDWLQGTDGANPAGHSIISVPIISADTMSKDPTTPRLRGVVDLWASDWSVHPSEDFLIFFGQLCAAALLRARSNERLTAIDQLGTIATELVSPRRSRALDTQKTKYLEQLIAIVRDFVRAECVSVFEADDSHEVIRCVASTGFENDLLLQSVLYRRGSSLTWRVFSTGRAVNLLDVSQRISHGFSAPQFSERRPHSDPMIDPIIAVPIPSENGMSATGVIRAGARRCHYFPDRLQAFASHDVEMLQQIASHASPILQLLKMQAHRELFVLRSAHQINQPLQGVIAYTSNILDGVYDRDPERRDNKLRYIRQMARAAAGMMRSSFWLAGVTDFSDLSSIRRTKKKLTSYFIERIIDLQPIREHDGIKVVLANEQESDRWGDFLVDEVFFEQAIQNLLHNGVKYAYPSTAVSVRLQRVERRLNVFVTSVGVPIPAEERERVFWDRERGSVASSYDPIGTGQGLFIARQIMRGFHGDVALLPGRPVSAVLAPAGFPAAEKTTFRVEYPEAFEL